MGLVRDMITRQDYYFPRYGQYPGYGIPGNNGFQEVFTASMMASLEWGSFEYAYGVAENWLQFYQRRNGSVAYRGLEMAQSARMLTNLAQLWQWSRYEGKAAADAAAGLLVAHYASI